MIGKELKKLSRRELIDVIYQLKKNEQQKDEQIAALEESLQDKRIRISVAGSIAEAAVDITNIFSSAQMTADLYLREITCMKSNAEKECAKMIDDAKRKVDTLLSDGKKQYDDMIAQYQSDYSKWEQLQAEIQRLEQRKNTD